MFITNCLTDLKNLTVIHPENNVNEVLLKMEGHLSLPCVTDDNEFVGMVSKRTIFDVFQRAAAQGETYDAFLQSPIEPCIDRTVPSLTPESHFEDTIDIIIKHPFIPIVTNGKLVGIVKRGDVNSALSIAFATHVDSTRLLLGMAEVEGALSRLFAVTHRLGVNVITAVPFDAGESALNRRLILKLTKTEKLDLLKEQLEKAGFLIIEVA